MAVTDLTDSLPWWARNGSGAAQGAGPTGTPSAAPQGAGGQPGAGDSTSWLQYLVQMYGPQQAMAMMQSGANPADMPSANATPMEADTDDHGTGDNPPVRPFVAPPGPPINNFGNPPAPVNPPGPGNTAPVPLSGGGPPPQPSAGPPVGAGMLDQSGVVRMGGPNGVLNTQPPTGASAPVGASLLDQSGVARNPAGVLTPGAASPAPAAAAPVPGPLASGGAGGVGSTSNPRFIGIDRPNADPTARRGSPQGTALNLAGLFGGRGQPAVNPNVPAAAAQPVASPAAPAVPGPLAAPGNQQMNPTQLAAAVSKPNWWQGLGRPTMNPNQLSTAIHKPNWYRNL